MDDAGGPGGGGQAAEVPVAPLCPQCHERPRPRHASGRLATWCPECRRARGAAKRRAKGIPTKARETCPRCKERPKYTNPLGHRQGYCRECINARGRERTAANAAARPPRQGKSRIYALTPAGEAILAEIHAENVPMRITREGLRALRARKAGETETGQKWKVRAPAERPPAESAERPRSTRAMMLDRLELLLSRRLTRFQRVARELDHPEAQSAAVDVADLVDLVFATARGGRSR